MLILLQGKPTFDDFFKELTAFNCEVCLESVLASDMVDCRVRALSYKQYHQREEDEEDEQETLLSHIC